MSSFLRIMLFGSTLSSKNKLCNFILGKKSLDTSRSHQAKTVEKGTWRGKTLAVVTPSESQMGKVEKEELKRCVSLCPPGPNVLLLLMNPSNFTEKDRRSLKATLSLFGEEAFKHSMVIITEEGSETSFAFNTLIRECQGGQYSMSENNHQTLMEKIEDIVKRDSSAFLSIKEVGAASKCDQSLPSLNLVLFGRKGAGKTSAAKAILGQTHLHSGYSSSECVKRQGEVSGHRVSVVELPALYGKAQQEVMKDSFRCVSLCEPEGVHAFILVLPVGPLTDEDKEELQTIQDTFSSRINNNTIILFTADSDRTHPMVAKSLEQNSKYTELIKRCGGRYVVVKNKDSKQFSTVIDFVVKMNQSCYTSATLSEAYFDKLLQKENNTELQSLPTTLPSKVQIEGKNKWTNECLRIVLIGKSGSERSSSGNTILGRNVFEAFSATSVTKCFKKCLGEVDGRPVAVVDTPGLFDNSLSNKEVQQELLKCLSLLAPGPHVFLVVVPIGTRFSAEEKETLDLIKEGFGQGYEKYSIMLFTRGDQLKGNKQAIHDFIQKNCRDHSFKKIINSCGGGYHMFDNSDTQNRGQVIELIRKIDTMVFKHGCFTNEVLQEAERAIQEKIKQILKEKEKEIEREKKKLVEIYQKEMMKKKIEEEKANNQKATKMEDDKTKQIKNKLQQDQEETMEEQEAEMEDLYANPDQSDDTYEHIYEGFDEAEQQESYYETLKEDVKLRKEQVEHFEEREGIYSNDLEYTLLHKLDKLIEIHEEEARRKAEELNDFKEINTKIFEAQAKVGEKKNDKGYNILKALKELTEKRNRINNRKEVTDLVKSLTGRSEVKNMLLKQAKEMKKVSQKDFCQLEKVHEKELSDLIEQLLDRM